MTDTSDLGTLPFRYIYIFQAPPTNPRDWRGAVPLADIGTRSFKARYEVPRRIKFVSAPCSSAVRAVVRAASGAPSTCSDSLRRLGASGPGAGPRRRRSDTARRPREEVLCGNATLERQLPATRVGACVTPGRRPVPRTREVVPRGGRGDGLWPGTSLRSTLVDGRCYCAGS